MKWLELISYSIFGRSVNGPAGYDISDEISRQNYLYDGDDVQKKRSKTLRSYIGIRQSPQMAVLKAISEHPGWAKIVGDALIGGHLKMNGTINFVGIPEPISVGDNLQFDNVVYHIEQINHSAFITQEGRKTFRTTVTLSKRNGVAKWCSCDVC